MRIRAVKPDFWRDGDSTGAWPIDEKLVYEGLWSIADDEGRLQWNTRQIRAELFPFPEGALLTRDGASLDLEAVLSRLIAVRRVALYQVEDRWYAWLPNFKKHQKISHPAQSKLPAPPKDILTSPGKLPEGSGNLPEPNHSGKLPEGSSAIGREGKGKEGSGVEGSAGERQLHSAPLQPLGLKGDFEKPPSLAELWPRTERFRRLVQNTSAAWKMANGGSGLRYPSDQESIQQLEADLGKVDVAVAAGQVAPLLQAKSNNRPVTSLALAVFLVHDLVTPRPSAGSNGSGEPFLSKYASR